MNAIRERVNGTLRRELLDRILIVGERHLALVLREYVAHYNGHRPHQSRQQRPPDIETQPARDVAGLRSVRRKPVVAGLINEYHQAALALWGSKMGHMCLTFRFACGAGRAVGSIAGL